MEGIVGELQCPVCLEFLQHPVILPCAHVLCRNPCAVRLFRSNFVRCPVCRDSSFVNGGVDSLPRVITLENIIDRYHNPPRPSALELPGELCGIDDVACQLCEDTNNPFKAKKSCLDCNASYCEKCLRVSHPNREPFIRHSLVSPTRTEKPVISLESKCRLHNLKVAIYCDVCSELCCILCADEPQGHRGHKMLTLKEATDVFMKILHKDLCYLQRNQELLGEQIRQDQRNLDDFEVGACAERRQKITEQCQQIASELEAKRDLFLSDLEYEARAKKSSVIQQIQAREEYSSAIQGLKLCSRESCLESNPIVFVELAKRIHDRTEKTLNDVKSLTRSTSPSATALHHKVLDLRKVRAIIRDVTYLSVPSKPQIAIGKCSRSMHSVVLVLCSPEASDVIDEYRVYYSTPQQQTLGQQSVMLFKTPGEERNLGRGPVMQNAVCLIHNDLHAATTYSFSVRAHNGAGESELSDNVQCSTLQESVRQLPEPVIVESMCRTYSCAIQIHSPSPCDVSNSSHMTFYLLYREADDNKIWKSLSLCGRLDHRVFGLDTDTMYDFVIMACDVSGECQVSNMVTLRTENAAR